MSWIIKLKDETGYMESRYGDKVIWTSDINKAQKFKGYEEAEIHVSWIELYWGPDNDPMQIIQYNEFTEMQP